MLYRISALQGAVKEAWTSRVALLDALQFLFDGTEQTLILRSRELGLSPSEDHSNWNTQETSAIANDAQAELKAALVEEAEFLLAIYEERLLFLKRFVLT